MNTEKKLPKSVRIFIRGEKSKIRLQFLDYKKQQEMISEVYKKAWASQEKKAKKAEAKAEPKKEEVKKEKVKKAKAK